MLKWLGKVLGADAAPPAAPVHEPPLPAPRVGLPEDGEHDEAGGFLSRQVIIGRECHPVGYFFAMRDRSRARIASHDQVAAAVNDQLMIRSVNGLGIDRIARYRQIWLELADGFLANPLIDTLPAAATVIVLRVHGAAAPDAALLARAAALRQAGIRFALARWTDTAASAAWLPVVQHIVVDVSGLNPADIAGRADALHRMAPAVGLVAMHVDSIEEFECCQRAPFALFQGGFLTRRESWPPQPRMNPQRTRLVQLLQKMQQGSEINVIAGELRHSPELVYRLLRYINAASMGLATRVASIEQALLLLGRERFYRWLTLLLFSSSDGNAIDGPLLEHALVRARFMELLAPAGYSSVQRDELFIVGVFSLLDMLLKLPLSVAVEPLALPVPVHDALVHARGPLAPMLRLALAAEAQDDHALADAAAALGIGVGDVNARHLAAISYAQEVLAAGADAS